MKSSTQLVSRLIAGTSILTATLALLFSPHVSATVLDNFDAATRTGWTDYPNGGHLSQSGGQLQVATAGSSGALTYGTKTSQTFANAANQTLEFRADVMSVVPGNGDPNAAAILAWLPSGAVPGSGSSGYSLWVTAGSATLKKGSTTLATASYTAAATNNQTTTLVLRMTPAGGSLVVNARVYRQTGALPMQIFTEVWETTQTASDTIGTPGYAALGVYSGASTSGATVSFDNLQDFPLQNTVLDDFTGGSADLANYSLSGYPATAAISGGTFELATPSYNNTIYAAARRTSPNYEIVDGSRLELSIDVVNNATGPADPYAVAVLGYTPFNNNSGVGSLVSYHIGPGCYALYLGKAYGQWWANGEPFPAYVNSGMPVPPSNPGHNMRLVLSMTGEGTSIRLDSRVEDLNVSVNDPGRLLYQNVFVDTAGVDPLDTSTTPHYPDGTSLPFGPAAYLNQPGSIVLYAFFGGNSTDVSDITYSNLVVNQTAPVNLPPSISNLSPPDRSNFVATAASQVSFQVTDDVNVPTNNISLTLNGVTYANGSGATVSGTTASKTFALNAPLAPDTFYSGSIQATDNVGLVTVQAYTFDTFRTNTCYVVESEDYNYGSGQYVEPYSTPVVNQYFGLNGTNEIDFHDSRTTPDVDNIVYRSDPVRNNITGDGPRAKYVGAGSPGEIVLVDRHNGDWNNYTHLYPAGWYSAYMRMSQYIIGASAIELERVTSDPTQTNQTTVPLGSFLGTVSGYDINHDVQLTDAFGNPLLVHFSGSADTLRVNNIAVEAPNAEVWQNYIVFAPAATPGSQPPFVSQVIPGQGAVLTVNAASTAATIVNRDSTVDTTSVIMKINGVTVPATTTPNANGAVVTWAPVSTSPTLTNTLIFKDNLNAWQTNTWTYSYGLVLQSTNSLPLGSLSLRGFDARLVQSSAANVGGGGGLNNSIATARLLLTNPPLYALDVVTTDIVQQVAWDLNATNFGAVTNFPGLCIPPSYGDSFAVETLAYLQLSAGPHRFYVDSDDCVGLYSGAKLTDPNAITLLESTGVFHGSVDVFAPTDGLYPFQVLFEQGQGLAYLVLKSVNLSNNSQVLVNAPGGVNAYYPVVCKSATSLPGPFTVNAAANAGHVPSTVGVACDKTSGNPVLNLSVTGGTLTVPISGPATYYRLDAPRPTRITSITKSASNVVITYQYQ